MNVTTRTNNAMRKITLCALLLSVSFCISIFEGFVPISAVIPVPGLKFGFANIAVVAALYLCGTLPAFCIVILRPLLSFIIFGNVTGSLLSLGGGIFSFIILIVLKRSYGKLFSFRGISCVCAVFHAAGQICAASVIMSDIFIFSYLPVLSAASCITGFLNGMVMNMVIPPLSRIYGEKYEK